MTVYIVVILEKRFLVGIECVFEVEANAIAKVKELNGEKGSITYGSYDYWPFVIEDF